MLAVLQLTMGNRILLLICALFTLVGANADDFEAEVRGRVFDAKTNAPLPFVNIWIKGTTHGTMSNAEGSFSLSAAYNDVICFSSVGYLAHEIVFTKNIQNPLKIALKADVREIGEVTVKPEESRAKVLMRRVQKHKKENHKKVEHFSDYKTFARTSVYVAIDSTSRVNRIIPNLNEVTMKLDGQSMRFSPIYMAEKGMSVRNRQDSTVYDKRDGIFRNHQHDG